MAVSHIWKWGESEERAASEGIFTKAVGQQLLLRSCTSINVDHERHELVAQHSCEEEI